MRKTKINLKSTSLYAILCCLILGLFVSNTTSAQTVFDPRVNCVNGCTAKDIKKITSALVYPTAPYDQLPSNFSCTSGQPVDVKLAVFLTTQTQKAGLYVYAIIRNAATDVPIKTVSECFTSGALTSVNGATKVVFNTAVTWTCGTSIKLTDVYVGWGTGTDDFCQGSSAPRCPATTSKCFALAPGEYVPVVVPTGAGASQTKCPTVPSGSTATFNLTESDATVRGAQPATYVVRYYSDAAGTTELTGTGKTAFVNTSNPQTVYAKVCSNISPFPCSALQTVTLNVSASPSAPTITPVAATCSAAGSSTISNYSASNTYVFTPSGPSAGAAGLISGMTVGTSYTVTSNNGTCPSSASGSFSNAAMLETPATPTITPVTATCSAAGSSTISNYSASNTYVFTPSGPSAGAGGVISGMIVGTSYTVKSNNGSCPSSASASFSNAAMLETPATPTITPVAATCSAAGSSTISNYSASNTYVFTPSGPSAGAGGVISGMIVGTSYTVKSNNGSCPSAASASFSNAASLIAPTFKVCVVQPTLCSTGSVTINASGGSGFLYTIDGTNPTAINTSNVFDNLGVGSVKSIKVKNSDGCSAAPVNCADIVSDCTPSLAARSATVQTQSIKIADEQVTTVKAFPNPFSGKVRFAIESPVSGKAVLNVYGVTGQKLSTVYQGYLFAGRKQLIDYNAPSTNNGTLIYTLKVGDKQVNGKVIQVK